MLDASARTLKALVLISTHVKTMSPVRAVSLRSKILV